MFVALFLAASIGTTALIRHPGAPMTTAGRPAGLPPAGHEEHDRPLGRPLKAPAGSGGFAYETTQADGRSPATWDPCRPIHYVTTGTAPAGAHSLLTSALARVSVVTGFQFIDDGQTDEFPLANRPAYQPDRYGGRWAPLLVAWTNPQQVPELAGKVIGLGGGSSVTARTGRRTIVSGILFLDAPQFAHDLAAAGAAQRSEEVRRQLRAVVLHEAGHLLGLAHVADPKQIMYPEAGLQVVDYGPGDLRGLNRLASGACAPDL